jgi:ectoine hydroxylase-related dioxygenase (phytanoyl-CoA dioxygenase family)
MKKMIDVKKLEIEGYCCIQNMIDDKWLSLLLDALQRSFEQHRQIQINNGNDIQTEGVALHVILSDEIFIEFLDELIKMGFIDDLKTNYFKSNFILNSFSGLDNMPNQLNFSSIVHRDLRFYTADVPIMLNMLVMLDDFTEMNGPTLLLPYSHKKEEKPTDEYFHENAIKITGKKGDVLIFNSNVWHASSLNRTEKSRRALPLTFTKSLIKQLLDYPRALGYDRMDMFNDNLRQLLGYHARVPANLEEWYQPFENRFYKKNQD